MASNNLEDMIKREEGNLNRYKAKQAEYAAKVKATETKLTELNMMRDSQQLNQLADMMSKSGLTLAELMAAMQSGDMLTLQEKMDAAASQPAEDTEDRGFGAGGAPNGYGL